MIMDINCLTQSLAYRKQLISPNVNDITTYIIN